MAVSIIDQFIDGLSEDWMKSVFVDRLDNARLLIDDETFGDTESANNAVASFLQLSVAQRLAEIERLRVRNVETQWAKTSDVNSINSLITILRTIRDNLGNQTGTTGEIGTTSETGEDGTTGETGE